MPHTDKATVVATFIQNLIDTNRVALGVDTVLYGDHEKIPSGMAVTVTAGRKERRLQGVQFPGGRTRNDIMVIIMVYLNKVVAEAVGRLQVDQTAENIETLLHQNTTMGGNIIHGFCRSVDPGIRFKDNSMFRTVQIIFVGDSKTALTP